MELQATSIDISFLDLDGEIVDQPREWTEALVALNQEPAAWESAKLTVNGITQKLSLRSIAGRVRVVAEWPRANAGKYVLRAELNGQVTTRLITIPPAKLGDGAFEAMLADLQSRLPATVAIGLQKAGGLTGLNILPPAEITVEQELARLRRAVTGGADRPGLTTILRDLVRDPHRRLDVDQRWAPTHLARRPHPAQLGRAVSSYANMASGDLPLRVIDQRVHETVDVYENRLVRLYHDQVLQRVLRLQRYLERSGKERPSDAVVGLRAELAAARRAATFLDEVSSPSYLPTTVTMVLLKRPAYRAAFEGYLELHRSLAVRLDDPRLDLPLENLPSLYQLWGTLSACSTLLRVAVGHGYRLESQRLVHRESSGAFIQMVPAGATAIRLVHPVHATVVSLIPEQSYGASGSFRSISFVQRPDITIKIERRGADPELLLLDPKYKLDSDAEGSSELTGKPKKIDIDKMHAYRDAIRDNQGRRIVSSACTIYPGPSVSYANGIEAIQGNPAKLEILEEHLRAMIETALRP